MILSLLSLIAAVASAQTPPAKAWKGSAELSFVNANGNTKSSTLANKDRFEYAKGPTLLELETGGFRATSGGRCRQGVDQNRSQ